MGRRLVARGDTSSASVPTNRQGRGFGDERRSSIDWGRRRITGAKHSGGTPRGSTLARLLRLLSIVLAAVAFGQADVVDEDREYLGILYSSLGGSDWHENANWTVSGVDVSEWEGVSVATDENGTEYVYEISLGDNNLVGDAFPAVEYGQLLGLQKLSLGGNYITGELPAGLENLVSLTLLDLSDNGFEGEIPPELGSAPSLVRLDLQGNALTGKIPSELGGMTQLGILYLEDNALEDIIPPELGNLASLTQLDLSGNTGLIGPIPPEFGGLVSLKALYMEDNSLTGDIPAELGTLAEGGELQAVDLRNNYLTGEVPEGLEQVSTLLLDGNFVDGYEQIVDDSTAPPYPTPAPATPVPTPAPTIATPTPTTASPSLSPSRAPTTPGPTTLATPAAATPSPTSASGTPASGALSTPGGGDGDDGADDADPAMVAGAVVGVLVFLCSVCWVCKGCWSWRRRKKEEQGGGSDDPEGTEEVTSDTDVFDTTVALRPRLVPDACPSDETQRTDVTSMNEDSDGNPATATVKNTSAVTALDSSAPTADNPSLNSGVSSSLALPALVPALAPSETTECALEVQLGSPRRRPEEELPPGVAPPDSPMGVQLGSPVTGPAPAVDIEIGVLLEAGHQRFLEMGYPGTPSLQQSASVGGGAKGGRAPKGQQVGRCRSVEATRPNPLDGDRPPPSPDYQADGASSSLGGGGGTSGGERRVSIITYLTKAARAAQNSSITGVPEVAMFVETLVTLKADNDGNTAAFDTSLELCSNLAKFLESITEDSASEIHRETGRRLLEGVQEKLDAVIDIIEAYKRKTKLRRMWTASMYRARVEEADASVRRMLEYFNSYVNASSWSEMQKVRAQLANHVTDECLRRQQHLERLIKEEEIPQGSIEINRDLVIGSGGAGEVYMANYDGFNAAAKVVSIKGGSGAAKQQQKKSFLAEADIMRRLSKSPRVVRVFGIITSWTSELVLVMEYMSGGDLFSFIKKHREEGLEIPAELTRELVVDVAHGMAYLHQHSTWHGDLKSLNILLDADGRAKISDFGTSHWTEQTISECLQSQTPGPGGFNHFTFHWAAPEVLEHGSASEQRRRVSLDEDISQPGHEHHQADRRSSPLAQEATARGLSFMSDVYSFGIVVWEVLSTQ
ncbi:unnamed protein product, partial [Ectocarpus sp. 8 AP-2014]